MSTHDANRSDGHGDLDHPGEGHGGDGHGEGHGTLATREDAPVPERFENPGLPEHRHRMADVDARAAKRAERQVAVMFGLSALGTILTIVGFYAVQLDHDLGFIDYLSRVKLSNFVLGFGLFLSLFFLGVGAVHWAKTLMPDDERVEYRHLQRGTDEERAAAVRILKEGAEETGLGRRPLLRNTLIGAMALLPLPAVIFLRDTGPLPGDALSRTFWKAGTRLMIDPTGEPIKASDLTIGSVAHIMPEGIEETEFPLDERAKAAVLVVRLNPDDLAEESQVGAYSGIVAYSKICSHMGCPVALYEQQTHHLLCPCHQSTFDLTQNCKVIFGPAKRPLPQLPITVDDEGYLVAKDGFSEAVGPSFWERG
jgi:ubiquinol-cytochrome c reductase iron-sulfur subunit